MLKIALAIAISFPAGALAYSMTYTSPIETAATECPVMVEPIPPPPKPHSFPQGQRLAPGKGW